MWRLLQLCDSGFPSGGYVHSGGLEAAAALGEVGDLRRFAEDALWAAAHGTLPLVRRAHRAPADAAHVDAAAEAFLLSAVANRASRAQGRALATAAGRAFGIAPLALPHGHLAPVWGVVGAAAGVGEEETLAAALFAAVRGVVSAAVRLGRSGPLEAQALLAQLPWDAALRAAPDDPIQTAPLIELHGALHDRLYSRLFQS